MAGVSIKGVRLSDGRKVQLLIADNPQKSDGSILLGNEAGAANGLATLNGSSLVVQEPASTSVSAAINSIVKRDANADVIVPTTPTDSDAAASKSYVDIRPSKGSATYAGAVPTFAEADALLPAVGDFGYFLKGATDTVFHLFRRSLVASTLDDFGIVQLT